LVILQYLEILDSTRNNFLVSKVEKSLSLSLDSLSVVLSHHLALGIDLITRASANINENVDLVGESFEDFSERFIDVEASLLGFLSPIGTIAVVLESDALSANQ
jgi:hypothetical protein